MAAPERKESRMHQREWPDILLEKLQLAVEDAKRAWADQRRIEEYPLDLEDSLSEARGDRWVTWQPVADIKPGPIAFDMKGADHVQFNCRCGERITVTR